MRRLAEILLLGCMVALLMGADTADERYERLGAKIMCTCGCSQMLLKCNHIGCPNSDPMIRQLRALVGAKREIAAGPAVGSGAADVQPLDNDQDVLNWFRNTWGVTAVVEPGTRGFELWAWILPVAAAATGFIAVVFVVRNWRQRPAHVSPQAAQLDPHLDALRERARRETEI